MQMSSTVKLLRAAGEEQDIQIVSKYLPTASCHHEKVTKSKCTENMVGERGRCQQSQVVKITIMRLIR